MPQNSSKTKLIAKNTIVLYLRMIITLLVTLYTSRIVLKALGFSDYGLYNVVGGVVALFSFLKSSMSSSTQRFLSYEMGIGNKQELRKVFSVCFTTHLLIAGILLLLAETVGLWFLNTQINIPEGREIAANWIYQFSVISLCISIISIPYDADIISNERMGYYAFLSILDALLKLGISVIILQTKSDRLILYGLLMLGVTAINLLLNWSFCFKNYKETHYRFYWDKTMFKRIFSFSGWTIWGQLTIVGSNQGTNILVNIFYSVVANAAMGVGHQVNNAITGLVSNFQTAFKPQITKSYAAKDYTYLRSLICYASKISFLLLFLVALPIVFNIDFILDLWLDEVPKYANRLCIIFIVASLCNAISGPLWMVIFATGNIKRYQIAMSIAYLLELLAVYILFKLGVSLVVGVSMKAMLNFFVVFIRLYYAHREMGEFSVRSYARNVLFPMSIISSLAILILFFFKYIVINEIIATICLIGISLFLSFYLGLNRLERKTVINTVHSFVKK